MKDFDTKTQCDDHYKCGCGAEFKLLTSLEGHNYLPEIIKGDKSNETKKLELKIINEELDKENV